MIDNHAPALARGLELLELIAREKEISFNRLGVKSSINTSSMNRLLKVLLDYGYIIKNSHSRYELGLKPLALAQGNALWQMLLNRSTPLMQELSSRFGVTCLLLGFSKNEIIALNKATHPDNIAMQDVGSIKRDYILTPWGFLFISRLPQQHRRDFINSNKQEYKDYTGIPSDIELDTMISLAAARGYADDEAKILSGNVRRLAVPVYGMAGEMVASLSVGSLTGLLNNINIQELVGCMKKKAEDLSCYIHRQP